MKTLTELATMNTEQQKEHCHICFNKGYGNCRKCALNAITMPCDECGQKLSNKGIGGEYLCPLCGIPTVHDESLASQPTQDAVPPLVDFLLNPEQKDRDHI
jgi:hypothetical protein